MTSLKLTELVSYYTGPEDGDITTWIKQVKLAKELSGTDKELTLIYPLFLKNDAFTVYDHLSADDKKDAEKVEQALLTAFACDVFTSYGEFRRRVLNTVMNEQQREPDEPTSMPSMTINHYSIRDSKVNFGENSFNDTSQRNSSSQDLTAGNVSAATIGPSVNKAAAPTTSFGNRDNNMTAGDGAAVESGRETAHGSLASSSSEQTSKLHFHRLPYTTNTRHFHWSSGGRKMQPASIEIERTATVQDVSAY